MANANGLFWNSNNGDRVYDADDFSEWLRKFYTTGVFNGDLQVSSGNGMVVTVGTGYANIKGKVRFFDTNTSLTLATAGASYPRIDTIVVECNYTNRTIELKSVTGTYSKSPKAQAPVRNTSTYQLVLAEIYVGAGASSISADNITDKRMDSNVCGYVTGTVNQIDFAGVEAQFNAWFENVKNTLGTDSAGNLKNQIDAINDKIGTTDISSIGDGTETGAISANASNISQTQAAINVLNSSLTKKWYQSTSINPSWTLNDLVSGKTYAVIVNVCGTPTVPSAAHEIWITLNGYEIGRSTASGYHNATFLLQSSKGGVLSVGSFLNNGTWSSMITRIICIPLA